ncbi:MAG TPA: GGDEF domain-containing protein, partial [Dissulfurispiraceae bacterium]
REKTAKCLSCRAFLPVGVFAVQGKKIRGTHNFINSHFSGALKNSVLYERAVYSASMDGLTNVFNRRSMEEQLLRSFKLSGKYNHPLSLCMLDIDHFKRFNDTHGHQAGDLVLRETADLISGLIREVDILARYGGEEFCIIFPHTDKALAFEVAERIRAEVENHEFSAGRRITISMGIANHPDDEVSSPQDLVKKADVALYHSKISRNTVAAYRQEFQDPVKGRFND